VAPLRQHRAGRHHQRAWGAERLRPSFGLTADSFGDCSILASRVDTRRQGVDPDARM
jgi:hypothetical protein